MSDSDPMRRTAGVSYEPESQADVLDFVTDYAEDAIDAGVHPAEVVVALEKARNEIEERRMD